MSSKSKSSSSTSTTTTNTDARVAADNGSIVLSGDGTLNVLDGGVIEGSFKVLDEVVSQAGDVAEIGRDIAFDAFGFVEKNISQTNALLTRVVDQDRDESTQISTQLIRIGLPVIALILIIRPDVIKGIFK